MLTITGTAYTRTGVLVDVEGRGFDGRTRPGDDGVYVGLAPAGGLPDTDDREEGMRTFAGVNWVSAEEIVDGALDGWFVATARKLRPGTAYAVYTWQAHSHSNPSQDTETAFAVDWDAVTPTVTVTARKAARTLVVRATGASGKAAGKVAVTFQRNGKKAKKVVAGLRQGSASVALPAGKGRWTARVVYRGSKAYTPARATATWKR